MPKTKKRKLRKMVKLRKNKIKLMPMLLPTCKTLTTLERPPSIQSSSKKVMRNRELRLLLNPILKKPPVLPLLKKKSLIFLIGTEEMEPLELEIH